MQLTVDQALQQGVAAHREGKLQDAEHLYRAILQAHPKHPDANHNLGVLAVAVGKPVEAIPLLKLALEVNPQTEEFWLSYIDALITLERFDDVALVLADAKQAGVASQRLDMLYQQLQQAPHKTNKSTRKGLIDSENGIQLADRKKRIKRDKPDVSISPAPPREQINSLLEHYESGRLTDAEKLAASLTQEFPKHPFGWKALGLVFQHTGRLDEALAAMNQSVELSPHDFETYCNLGATLAALDELGKAEAAYKNALALKPDHFEAHYNLGGLLRTLGKLDEAEASFRQAIASRPNHAGVHNNLGSTLRELGRVDEAEAVYRRAIALEPDQAGPHNNLGNLLVELGRLNEAITAYAQAVSLKSNYTAAYVNLGKALRNGRFGEANRTLYPVLIKLLTSGDFVRPSDVVMPIVSLLKHDPVIEDLLMNTQRSADARAVVRGILALDQLPLLHHLMQVCPLPDLQLEEIFVTFRRVLLGERETIETPSEVIYFLSTLSLHCFTNEYVYFESEEETLLIAELERQIAAAITQKEQLHLADVLCLATYRPLYRYDWCQRLEVLDQIPSVKVRLIDEPLIDRKMRQDLPVLTNVSNEVSQAVREQYEENPYPRWVKLGIPVQARSMAHFCDEARLQLLSDSIRAVSSPSILIAGCGTGQQAITAASRYPNCRVTAVDLSLTSLAYAKRKTTELGISNIDYLQADILELDQLKQEFDVIECSGVLHHMDDPMAGWRVLVGLLKTGGVMKIGVYSELARRHIRNYREQTAAFRMGTSQADIRKFRRVIVESTEEHHKRISMSFDFFSLSMLRDLIFHRQEHRFTLPQIHNCLGQLGLLFSGFEQRDLVSKFKKHLGRERDPYDLLLWHQFEERHPHTFMGMYQFWCQKM